MAPILMQGQADYEHASGCVEEITRNHPSLAATRKFGQYMLKCGISVAPTISALEGIHMNIDIALKEAMGIDGALGAALVDWQSGLCLGTLGGDKFFDLNLAAAGNTDVVRAKMRTVESLNLDDTIEDILITLDKQYHLIRLLRNPRNGVGLFLYLVLDRNRANLALARHTLARIEGRIAV
jgi:hypothetical protein